MSVKQVDLFEMPDAIKYADPHEPLVINGVYSHYKEGREYVVICAARNSERPSQEMVCYRARGKEQIWVRPKNMFLEVVDTPAGDGFMTVPRFQYAGKLHDD